MLTDLLGGRDRVLPAKLSGDAVEVAIEDVVTKAEDGSATLDGVDGVGHVGRQHLGEQGL